MPAPPVPSIEVRVHERIGAIAEAEWDALVGVSDAPFLRWTFLDALEATGCVGDASGWVPHHLTFHMAGKLVAAAPAYAKMNSEGEFVFDFAWAGAAERAGIAYYPKLVVAVPFTPATAPRLLLAPGADAALVSTVLANALRQICTSRGWSSAHVLFPPVEQAEALASAGMSLRLGTQFHWKNHGYTTFDDYLARFSSKRRNQIKREVRDLATRGIVITTHRDRLAPELVDAMYGFYTATVDKFMWGRRYLNRPFFEELASRLPGGVELVLARDGKEIVGGALNFAGDGALFGRYWGAREDIPFLHFNVCFYHPIAESIARGTRRFEPGAGGRHKLARGFEPSLTYSAHHVLHAGLDRAVRAFLEEEREVHRANAKATDLAWR